MNNGEDSLSKAEPYLEHIESKEIKKLVHRLYEDQPDKAMEIKGEDKPMAEKRSAPAKDSHDYIASEIDKLLKNSDSLDQHATPTPTETPLPEFPATEKPKKIEKPKRPEKKRGFFGFFKK